MSGLMFAGGTLIAFGGAFLIAWGLLNAVLNKMPMGEIQLSIITGTIILVGGGIVMRFGKSS